VYYADVDTQQNTSNPSIVQSTSPLIPNTTPVSPTHSTSSDDLLWDHSPSQLQLSDQSDILPFQPNPSMVTTSTPFPPNSDTIRPFTRTRLFATSLNPLSRTPAFKKQVSDQAFLQTPNPSTPFKSLPSTLVKKSRIPTPTTSSNLDLKRGTNLAAILPPEELPRRSHRLSNPPERYRAPTTHPKKRRKKRDEEE